MIRMPGIPIIALGAAAIAALPLGTLGARGVDPVHPATLDAPDVDQVALRALSEIDGDPATFTADERRKMLVLAQVLGTSPLRADPAAPASS